ncbi:unnamed protein product [Effrenium voratum]|nr:unnamed protein product [Effrenium voratum]
MSVARTVYTFFSSVDCTNADTLTWAQLRRGSDAAFMARLTGGGESLAPCGLVNIALFTDSYVLERSTQTGWEVVTIDESGVALPADSNSFNKVYEDQGVVYLANQRASWLSATSLEHWKVWQRTPPGSTVRNLWGVVSGGLSQGSYRIRFTENSPVWDEWGVPERRLIITGQFSALGNGGAIRTLAGTMLLVGAAELAIALAFLALWLRPAPPEAPAPALAEAPADCESQRMELEYPKRESVHAVRV